MGYGRLIVACTHTHTGWWTKKFINNKRETSSTKPTSERENSTGSTVADFNHSSWDKLHDGSKEVKLITKHKVVGDYGL